MEREKIILEIKKRVNEIDIPKGCGLFLVGSIVDERKEFKPDSDIDIWFTCTIGTIPSLRDYKRIKKQLGKEIEGHEIHFFAPYSLLLFGKPVKKIKLKDNL